MMFLFSPDEWRRGRAAAAILPHNAGSRPKNECRDRIARAQRGQFDLDGVSDGGYGLPRSTRLTERSV
jgi:hypothetical protein